MIEAEKIRKEIAEKLQGLMGRIEYSPQGIAQVNDAMSEIVRRIYNAGEIEAGETNDLSSNGEIRLAEGTPLEILTFIPGALPCQVSEYGKYRVIQGGEIIGYVTYSGPPKQDTVGCAYIGTKANFAPVERKL